MAVGCMHGSMQPQATAMAVGCHSHGGKLPQRLPWPAAEAEGFCASLSPGVCCHPRVSRHATSVCVIVERHSRVSGLRHTLPCCTLLRCQEALVVILPRGNMVIANLHKGFCLEWCIRQQDCSGGCTHKLGSQHRRWACALEHWGRVNCTCTGA